MHRLLSDGAHRDDDGMTVAEVLFASAILLIGLTSMLALLMTSTGLSAKARAQGLAVKTANQFIETIRAKKYTDLNQSNLNSWAAGSSGTVGGMTTVITASITPHFEASQVASSGANAAYQAIKILVAVSGPGLKTFRFSTGTYVREWHWSAAGAENRTVPTVLFDSGTPPAGATSRPIWNSVHIGATAVSNMADVVLTQVYVKWGTSYIATSTPAAATGNCSADWDTTLLGAEGRKVTLFAETWDALNQSDSKSRDFIIDNVRPPAPSAVTLSSTTGNSAATWAWPTVMDGESAVPDYVVTLYTMGSSGAWTGVAQAPVAGPLSSLPTAGFTKYYPSVVARGPRATAGLTPDWVSPATSGPALLTKPNFTAMNVTVDKMANNDKPFSFTATSLSLTPPTFPVTSPSYKWEYKVGAGAWTSFASAASPNTNPSAGASVSYAQVAPAGVKGPQDLSFRCTATVTIAGVVTVVKSPIMTKTAANDGSYTLASFTADWTTSW